MVDGRPRALKNVKHDKRLSEWNWMWNLELGDDYNDESDFGLLIDEWDDARWGGA